MIKSWSLLFSGMCHKISDRDNRKEKECETVPRDMWPLRRGRCDGVCGLGASSGGSSGRLGSRELSQEQESQPKSSTPSGEATAFQLVPPAGPESSHTGSCGGVRSKQRTPGQLGRDGENKGPRLLTRLPFLPGVNQACSVEFPVGLVLSWRQ